MKKIYSIIFLFIIAFTSAHAQSLSAKINAAYQRLSSDPQLKYATVSFSVLDANSGDLIFGANENTGVAPASTLKTITSATAIALLGEDYTFKTDIGYNGNIENGVLNGDLIIKGNGDPTLGSWRWESTSKTQILNKILYALQQNGIKEIKGKIVGDDSNWDSQSLPTGWIWQDIGNYYGAGTSALTWGENQFELGFVAGKSVGSEVKIANNDSIYPFLEIKNELTTGNYGSGDNVYAYSAPYTNLIYLRGTYGIDLKKKIGLSHPNPALAIAYDVRQYLQKNNISSTDFTTSRTNSSKSLNLLSEIASPPLKEIIYWFNQKSINLYGEQFLRVLGEKFGKSASTVDGIKVLKKFWDNKGIDPETLNIGDGSGLSPADRVTSLTMAKVLLEAKKQAWFPSYFKSLPVYNDMKMKSGTISDVLGYAGYADGKTPVCFSLIINNYSGSSSSVRQKMYQLLNNLK